MYVASSGFWWQALRRTRRQMLGRALPRLALMAAYCFVVMLFNLPLPGGTTGHALGVGIAAIVLGPWGGMLAVSLALTIQALFFGDGGITTLGANCFNMAIAGSLAAWGIYHLLSMGSAASSRRRLVAAGLAGYGSINLAALLAAVELGIQPMLFHDAAGAPLYAPYPLHVAIPAMMAGHLTIAGVAEALMTAGLFAYLRRSEPALLGLAKDDAAPRDSARAVGRAGLADAAGSAGNFGRRRGVGRVGSPGLCRPGGAGTDCGGERERGRTYGGAEGVGTAGGGVDGSAAGLRSALCEERGIWILSFGHLRSGNHFGRGVAGAIACGAQRRNRRGA